MLIKEIDEEIGAFWFIVPGTSEKQAREKARIEVCQTLARVCRNIDPTLLKQYPNIYKQIREVQ